MTSASPSSRLAVETPSHSHCLFKPEGWGTTESLEKLIARLVNFPTVPEIYNQVIEELAKEDPSMQLICDCIAQDPAMTSKILHLVNSAAAGLAVKIATPMEAIFQLGVERTKSFLLAGHLMLHFEKSHCAGFSHEQLWGHSLAVGASARTIAIAHTKDGKLAEAAFTAGLLHDVGKLLLAANLPDIYSQVLRQTERRKISVREAEFDVFDASHAELAAVLLAGWGLPMGILEAIAWHHTPEKSKDSSFSLLTAVHVANAIEHEKSAAQGQAIMSPVDSNYLGRLDLRDCAKVWRQICGCRAE